MPAAPTETLISSDSHVNITHDQVKEHLRPKLHGAYDDAVAGFGARMAKMMSGGRTTYQRPAEGLDNSAFDRRGYSDPAERLKDMDVDGVRAEVLYSEVSAFRFLYLIKDGLKEATVAFNDAMAEFGAEDPDRLIVSYQIPIHDIDFATSEVERVAAAGGRSLQLPVSPAELGCPDYFDESYDRLWATIQETGLPICCHIGLNTQLDDLARRDPTPQRGVMVPMTALSAGEPMGMWIMGGTFERFPHLKVVFVEPGLGWVAWWLYIVDDMRTRQGYEFPAISELPSFYFHRNVFLTFIEEPDALQHLRHRLGSDNIMWSTDYPHPVTAWPNSRRIVAEQFEGIPDAERQQIVCQNAARVWNL
jgi:uncharacterized protein